MIDYFHYRDDRLLAEEVDVTALAEKYGTPCYLYSRTAITQEYQAFEDALKQIPHQICYAVKANSNLAVLHALAEMGSGFDVVSVGELERVLASGGEPHKIVFAGVGKQSFEIRRALEVGISCFNVESLQELLRINDIAGEMNKIAPIALRINPNVASGSHPYISTGLKENKFGIDIDEALALYKKAATLPHLQIIGVAFHIGSQLVDVAPFLQALDAVLMLVDQLAAEGISLQHIDAGGGLGVRYANETPPALVDYVGALVKKLEGRQVKLILEPGRALVANAGILLTKVEYIKETRHKTFAIVDAGMNDLLRPALYSAWQDVVPVKIRHGHSGRSVDVVGPVCESADFLALDRRLNIEQGDLLAIKSAGAYGFVMSSNYNSRPRAAEVMISGNEAYLIRRRETIQELFLTEMICEEKQN